MVKTLRLPKEAHDELVAFCDETQMPLGQVAKLSISRFVSSDEARRILEAHRAAKPDPGS